VTGAKIAYDGSIVCAVRLAGGGHALLQIRQGFLHLVDQHQAQLARLQAGQRMINRCEFLEYALVFKKYWG
jgi:hypothetical protein